MNIEQFGRSFYVNSSIVDKIAKLDRSKTVEDGWVAVLDSDILFESDCKNDKLSSWLFLQNTLNGRKLNYLAYIRTTNGIKRTIGVPVDLANSDKFCGFLHKRRAFVELKGKQQHFPIICSVYLNEVIEIIMAGNSPILSIRESTEFDIKYSL